MILKARQKWFEVWGNEVAQNEILKYLLLIFAVANLILAISLTVLALRSPPIFAVSSIDTGMLRSDPPPKEFLEREAKRVVTGYLELRHNWDFKTIQNSIGQASRFVDSSFRNSFLQANSAQIKIANEKKISQQFYIRQVNVDIQKATASVSGERILTIDGFKAVSSLSFNLKFRLGDRTEQNPEGIYIVSEQLIENGKEQ